MAEEISATFVAGQLQGIEKLITVTAVNTDRRFDEVGERLDRSDNQTEAKFEALDAKMEVNKDEAIAKRDERHDEIKGDIRELRETMDGTAVIARDGARWIAETGAGLVVKVDNLHDRVTAIEDGKRIAAAEERGQMKTWGLIGGAAVTGGGMIGGLLEYWHVIIDFVKGLGRG